MALSQRFRNFFLPCVELTAGGLGHEVDGPCLGPHVLAGAIDPDVHALGVLLALGQAHVPELGNFR